MDGLNVPKTEYSTLSFDGGHGSVIAVGGSHGGLKNAPQLPMANNKCAQVNMSPHLPTATAALHHHSHHQLGLHGLLAPLQQSCNNVKRTDAAAAKGNQAQQQNAASAATAGTVAATGLYSEVRKQKQHSCHQCEFRTDNKAHLTRHITTVHMKIKGHACETCDFRASQKAHLQRHVASVHMHPPPPPPPQPPRDQHGWKDVDFAAQPLHHKPQPGLDIRDMSLSSAAAAAAAAERLQATAGCKAGKVKQHACPHCDFRTDNKAHLTRHVTTVHLKLKQHCCSSCDFRASQKAHLQRHISSVHLKLRAHACKDCDYKSNQKVHLQKHIRSVHQQVKAFKCNVCNFQTAKKVSMENHISIMHQQQQQQPSLPPPPPPVPHPTTNSIQHMWRN